MSGTRKPVRSRSLALSGRRAPPGPLLHASRDCAGYSCAPLRTSRASAGRPGHSSDPGRPGSLTRRLNLKRFDERTFVFPPYRNLTPLCTNLHQRIPLTRNGPVGHEIRTSKTGAGLLLLGSTMLGQKPNTPSNPMRPAQAMNTTTLRTCLRTSYEGCDPVPFRPSPRDSAGFPRLGSDRVI